jgi:hypothetical protein
MDRTLCPECGAVADVVWRAVMESTDGPVEHAKISCEQRHWFLLPIAMLPGASATPLLAARTAPGDQPGPGR